MTDIYLQGNALLCRCSSGVKSTETDLSFRAGKPLTAGYYLSLERSAQRKSSGDRPPPSKLSMSFPRSERQITSGYGFQIKIFHTTFYNWALRSHDDRSGFDEEAGRTWKQTKKQQKQNKGIYK